MTDRKIAVKNISRNRLTGVFDVVICIDDFVVIYYEYQSGNLL